MDRYGSTWLRVIDEELVGCGTGIVQPNDTYEDAKNKLNSLIAWHVAVALDPKCNGGFKLVPVDECCYDKGGADYGLPC